MVDIKVPRIRTFWWIIIGIVVTIIPLGIAILINIVFDITWWLTGGVAIFEAVVGILLGIIILILKLKKKPEPRMRQSPREALDRVKESIVMDEDNPDNLIPEQSIVKRVGEPGQPRTPILHITGRGSEKNTKIDILVNLDNPKLEMSRMDDKTEEEVKEAIRTSAENPETVEVQTTKAFDILGKKIGETEIRRVSKAEKEAIKEKEEADKANVY